MSGSGSLLRVDGVASEEVGRVELPPKLISVFSGKARYRGAYGGRGSGKTRSFAMMAAVHGYRLAAAGEDGVVVCGREFMNSLDDSSLSEVRSAILSTPWLARAYRCTPKTIRTLDGRIRFVFAGLRYNLASIRSKSKIHLIWVDEADPVSELAWSTVIPTVREEDSEVWATWNPERRYSATHRRFRVSAPKDSRIVEMNFYDNPWFPSVLEQERRVDLQTRPEEYPHIWLGDFRTVVHGAYYARQLAEARTEGRVGDVPLDPVLPLKAFWDIGFRDATAVWVAQFSGLTIRVLAYYEAVCQPLATHLNWLRENGYARAVCYLPHDGSAADAVTGTRFVDHVRAGGFEAVTVPNQGAGAALKRVEAARRLFAATWFDESRCGAGLEALGAYHEHRDAERNIGLGPRHDWSSHGADAFGMLCMVRESIGDGSSARMPFFEPMMVV